VTDNIWPESCLYPIRMDKMIGIRQKLSLGFAGLVVILLVIGIQGITLFAELGESIDVILRENYRSVIACQEMKEALERMNNAALLTLLGYGPQGVEEIQRNGQRFQKALDAELENITLPGELEKATSVKELFQEYQINLAEVQNNAKSLETRRDTYVRMLLPVFQKIEDTANDILKMNHDNMSEANERARRIADSAQRRMIILLVIGVGVAGTFVALTGKWVLKPIVKLTESVEEIKRGNLDLVVSSDSRDEIGQLSRAFNTMAESLRQFRRSGRARLLRVEQATEQAFKNLPEAVAVADIEGMIEVATKTARSVFELNPCTHINSVPLERLAFLFHEAIRTALPAVYEDGRVVIQRFIQGEEHYFLPKAVPILDKDKQPTGVILIIEDVTQQRQEEELKRGIIATVSHQLKTPLTSIRMAIHLLLDEKIGHLTEKQAELLVVAREEGERLYTIIVQLLQISRIESGKLEINLDSVSPHELIFDAVQGFTRTAQDNGITLTTDFMDDLPPVLADRELINHVFANLLSNALNYTPPGGKVILSASADDHFVKFSVVDTGKGIPNQYLKRILEQFFRVPGQQSGSGIGLGLAIVKQIVEAHGGVVTVESLEGEGSTFSISLKRSSAPVRELETV
jgi:two-component system, NtrC family, sensor histidine kinase KinB